MGVDVNDAWDVLSEAEDVRELELDVKVGRLDVAGLEVSIPTLTQ